MEVIAPVDDFQDRARVPSGEKFPDLSGRGEFIMGAGDDEFQGGDFRLGKRHHGHRRRYHGDPGDIRIRGGPGVDPGTEGIAGEFDPVGPKFFKIIDGGKHILLFSLAILMRAAALPHSPEVEAEGGVYPRSRNTSSIVETT